MQHSTAQHSIQEHEVAQGSMIPDSEIFKRNLPTNLKMRQIRHIYQLELAAKEAHSGNFTHLPPGWQQVWFSTRKSLPNCACRHINLADLISINRDIKTGVQFRIDRGYKFLENRNLPFVDQDILTNPTNARCSLAVVAWS
jgi:hypothetical protein